MGANATTASWDRAKSHGYVRCSSVFDSKRQKWSKGVLTISWRKRDETSVHVNGVQILLKMRDPNPRGLLLELVQRLTEAGVVGSP